MQVPAWVGIRQRLRIAKSWIASLVTGTWEPPKSGHYTLYLAEHIPKFRRNRRRTRFAGCYMCNGLFIKADNKLTCQCLIGYRVELGDISTQHVGDFLESQVVRYIRSSFAADYEPFPICNVCGCRLSEATETSIRHSLVGDKAGTSQGFLLHVEPANMCNLFCDACLCTAYRKSSNPAQRTLLTLPMLEKALRELHEAKVVPQLVTFAGYGEPLLNPRIPDMSRLVRNLFPASLINLDTNANHRPKAAMNIADCGFDVIRLALDGSDQSTYETYRTKGVFAKAIAFTEALVQTIRERGSKTRPVWKYILFRHNDRDDQILDAISMADRIGLDIEFDCTCGPWASQRTRDEIRRSIGGRKMGANIDLGAYCEVTE